jgi:hypothetical protein
MALQEHIQSNGACSDAPGHESGPGLCSGGNANAWESKSVDMQARWLAVTMLLCFMGATLGWSISWQLLLDSALLAYLSGATAQQLYDQLLPQEFSQAGEIFKAVSSASVAPERINSEAFARHAAHLPCNT